MLGVGSDNISAGTTPLSMGDNLAFVDLGANEIVTFIAMGYEHACVLLAGGKLKCWGKNDSGQLGLGDTNTRGDNGQEMGDNLPVVDLGIGNVAIAVAAGQGHSCAILGDGRVKCWGNNAWGQLGLGTLSDRGDNPGEMGDQLPAVNLGTGRTALALAAGANHTCALLDNATIKCWGNNDVGQLGLGDTLLRGSDPSHMGDSLAPVDLGSGITATAVAAGIVHTCAFTNLDEVKCWGKGRFLVANGSIGDQPNEMGDKLPAVSLSTLYQVVGMGVGADHTCALFYGGRIKCWSSSLDATKMGDALYFVAP